MFATESIFFYVNMSALSQILQQLLKNGLDLQNRTGLKTDLRGSAWFLAVYNCFAWIENGIRDCG